MTTYSNMLKEEKAPLRRITYKQLYHRITRSQASYGFIVLPEGRLAHSAHIPTEKTLGELAPSAVNAFGRLADRPLGTKQQDFSELTQDRGRSS